MQMATSQRVACLFVYFVVHVASGHGVPRRPHFSWDTVPVYQHLASPNSTLQQPFEPKRLAWLARFPLIIIEHAQGQGPYMFFPPPAQSKSYGPEPYDPAEYGSHYFEEYARATAASIKRITSSAVVLYYQNAQAALPYYRLSEFLAEISHPEVRLKHKCAIKKSLGDGMLPYHDEYTWNHSIKEVTEHFVAGLLNTTANSALDGTFVDTTGCFQEAPGQDVASIATVQAMQRAAPHLLVGFHTRSTLKGAGLAPIGAAMDYTLAIPSSLPQRPGTMDQSGKAAVDWMDSNYEAGVISLAHIGDVAYGSSYNYSLAIFLAGVNELSYFAFSSTYKGTPDFENARWKDCWTGDSSTYPDFPTWCSGQGYSPDFFRPLGRPVAKRVVTGRGAEEVHRAFSSGTQVFVDLLGSTCVITWADGSETVCAAGRRAPDMDILL